ncbi:unnamed protein product [Urochloa humidicola]
MLEGLFLMDVHCLLLAELCQDIHHDSWVMETSSGGGDKAVPSEIMGVVASPASISWQTPWRVHDSALGGRSRFLGSLH